MNEFFYLKLVSYKNTIKHIIMMYLIKAND